MMKSAAMALVATIAMGSLALAQAPQPVPQARPIKALSDQQIADLKAGRGMGLRCPPNSTAIPGPAICWNWPTGSVSPTSNGNP
jgi:hypothetical protein